MAHLVVLGLESPAKAEEGKVRIHQAVSLTGAGAGALAGKLADVGINDDTIKPYNPTVIQTNLTKDREEELVKALQA
jgi:uncharacterized membrane protein